MKRILESIDELDRLRVSLVRQGADASDVMTISDHVEALRGALGR